MGSLAAFFLVLIVVTVAYNWIALPFTINSIDKKLDEIIKLLKK